MKKIGKGKPLTELVKGSLSYTLDQIRRAFNRQFPWEIRQDKDFWLVEIFADYVIVSSDDLQPDEYYQVAYRKDGDEYVFADQSEWEVVELTYQPQSVEEKKTTKNNGKRLIESQGQVELVETGQEITMVLLCCFQHLVERSRCVCT